MLSEKQAIALADELTELRARYRDVREEHIKARAEYYDTMGEMDDIHVRVVEIEQQLGFSSVGGNA